jgi:hypothetical protein
VRAEVRGPTPAVLPCALDRVLELAVPKDLLGLAPKETLELVITLRQAGEVMERHPAHGVFELTASAEELEVQTWSV